MTLGKFMREDITQKKYYCTILMHYIVATHKGGFVFVTIYVSGEKLQMLQTI